TLEVRKLDALALGETGWIAGAKCPPGSGRDRQENDREESEFLEAPHFSDLAPGCGVLVCRPWCKTLSRAQLILDGKLADALAGRGKDGVRDCRRDADRARFADTARRFAVLHKVHLDLRSFIHAQDAIVIEVMLFHAAILERDLAPECGAK